MRYYFTREDLDALDREINAVRDRIALAAKEMGVSCQQSSETFHDNFGFEQAERDRGMWSSHLHQLLAVRNNAEVVTPGLNRGVVYLGRTVKVFDLDSSEEKTFRIGSYMVLNAEGVDGVQVLSYDTPLAKALIGAREGEHRSFFLGEKEHHLVVLKIE